MKKMAIFKVHSFQEGLLFLFLGGALMGYSLEEYGKSFNKDWLQSPFLFPMIIGVLLGVLAMALVAQGIRQYQAGQMDAKKKGDSVKVLIVLGITLLYYVLLSTIRLPYMAVTVFGLILTLSTFEIATWLFLLVMLLYLGVRNKPVLILLPLGSSLFLSITFRSLLHVLLP